MSALIAEGAAVSVLRMSHPAQAMALLVAGSLLLAVAVVWRRVQHHQLGGTDSGIDRCLGNMLGESGRWGGVQLLWLPVASRDDVLQNIERDADTPDAMLELLQTQAASLSGAVHWTVVQEQCATEWLQQMLDQLARVQVPAVRTRSRQLLFALVFVGSERPSSRLSLTTLIAHVRACAAVGLVSCDPLPIAGVAPAARVASAAMALTGLVALLIPGIFYVLGHMTPPPVPPPCQSVQTAAGPLVDGEGSGRQGPDGGASRPLEPVAVDTPPSNAPAAGTPHEAAALAPKAGLEVKRSSKDLKDGRASKAGKGEKGERPPREVSGGRKDAPPELDRPSSEQPPAGPTTVRGGLGAPAARPAPSTAGPVPPANASPQGAGQQ